MPHPSIQNIVDGPALPSRIEEQRSHQEFLRITGTIVSSVMPRIRVRRMLSRDDTQMALYRGVYDERSAYLAAIKESLHNISDRALDTMEKRLLTFFNWLPKEVAQVSLSQKESKLKSHAKDLKDAAKELRAHYRDRFELRELLDYEELELWVKKLKKLEFSYDESIKLAGKIACRFGRVIHNGNDSVRVLISDNVPEEVQGLANSYFKIESDETVTVLKAHLTNLFVHLVDAKNSEALFTEKEILSLDDYGLVTAYLRRTKVTFSDNGKEILSISTPTTWYDGSLMQKLHKICTSIERVKNAEYFDEAGVKKFLGEVVECVRDEKSRRQEAYRYRAAFLQPDSTSEKLDPISYRKLSPEEKLTHINAIVLSLTLSDRFSIIRIRRLGDALVNLAAFELQVVKQDISPISENGDSNSQLLDRLNVVAQAPLSKQQRNRLSVIVAASDLEDFRKWEILSKFCDETKLKMYSVQSSLPGTQYKELEFPPRDYQ